MMYYSCCISSTMRSRLAKLQKPKLSDFDLAYNLISYPMITAKNSSLFSLMDVDFSAAASCLP